MVGQPTVSAGISQFGGYVAGGVSAYFSDMLGDRALGVSAQVAGDLADIGASVAYVNRRHRWNWAAVVEQTPYRVDYITAAVEPDTDEIRFTDRIDRQTIRGVTGIAAFPFSQVARLELSGGWHTLSFTRDLKVAYYTADTHRFQRQETERLPGERTLHEASVSAALVYDTSIFGATSPILGRRHRLQVGQNAGSLRYTTLMADWRRYFMPKRPVTFAVRAMHYGRYGADADAPELISLYAGYPELVHGYGLGSISPADCEFVVGAYQCKVADDLVGSRMAVVNAEVRAPLVGLFRGDLQYGSVPIELAAFVDAGMTWTKDTRPAMFGGTRDLLRSVGAAARVNAFGLFIVEIAASRPLDRPSQGWRWQIGMREGF
jgi:outer membrane protein assembly factor BamA